MVVVVRKEIRNAVGKYETALFVEIRCCRTFSGSDQNFMALVELPYVGNHSSANAFSLVSDVDGKILYFNSIARQAHYCDHSDRTVVVEGHKKIGHVKVAVNHIFLLVAQQ